MKNVMRVLMVMILVLAMVTPSFAANTGFVGSIDEKPATGLMSLGTDEHGIIYGIIYGPDGKQVACLHEGDIIVTPLAKIDSMGDILSQDTIKLMWKVYRDMQAGKTDLADIEDLQDRVWDELGKHMDANDLVVRELFDVTILNGEYLNLVQKDGYTLKIKFNLQLDVKAFLEVMSYVENHWELAESIENTGDGIVVVLEHLCPVAFLVEEDGADDSDNSSKDDANKPGSDANKPGSDSNGNDDNGANDSNGSNDSNGANGGQDGNGSDSNSNANGKTGDESNPALWGGLAVVALAGIAVLFGRRRKAEK